MNTTNAAPETLEHNEYGDWVKCVCGNEPHLDGFYPCIENDVYAVEVEPTVDGPWDGIKSLCATCGRIFEQETFTVVRGPGPVQLLEN